jgi:hypothetical protein
MAIFTVKWTNFTVLKKHDIDRDKPYLWVFGIVVDVNSISSRSYVIRKPSTSDNLGQKFKKGDSVSVPSNLDISREIAPLAGVATAGVVVVAWENAMTRDSVIANAYDTAADTINEFVHELVVQKVGEIGPDNPIEEIDFEPSSDQIAELRADVDAKIRATIRAGWSVFQLVHDHNIGLAYTLVSLEEQPDEVLKEHPYEECLDYRFRKGATDYNLEADLFYGIPEVPAGTLPDGSDLPIKHQGPKPTSGLPISR